MGLEKVIQPHTHTSKSNTTCRTFGTLKYVGKRPKLAVPINPATVTPVTEVTEADSPTATPVARAVENPATTKTEIRRLLETKVAASIETLIPQAANGQKSRFNQNLMISF